MNSSGNFNLGIALEQAEEQFRQRNPASAAAHQLACQVMPGGNTRTVLHTDPFPLLITAGEGATLTDADGHQLIDMIGEYTAGLFGHSHPLITRTIHQVLDEGILLCGPNRFEAEFAGLICDRFASVAQLRFCNSGTEANLMAVTAARAYTGKTHIMAFRSAYHGGVLSFSSNAVAHNAPYPCVLGTYNNASDAARLIAQHADRLAAVLVEPMMGTAGAIPADEQFLQTLRDACTAHQVVLVFDEVMTSRTGSGGIQGQLGIVPDITTFGKYMGGGMSFGAFGGSEALIEQFNPRQATHLPHAGTFNNNVLTMAAGIQALGHIYTADVADTFTASGNRFRQQLQSIADAVDVPVQMSGTGSLMNIHFTADAVTNPDDTAAVPAQLLRLLHLWMINAGFYLGKSGYIALMLPLDDAAKQQFADAFEQFLRSHRKMIQQAVLRSPDSTAQA